MKYRVTIPPPPAKRLVNKVLTIRAGDGWGQGWRKSHTLTTETEFEFDVPDDTEWCGNTSTIDGMVFDVWVEYTNLTGSRTSTVNLVPQKILTDGQPAP